MHFLVMSPFSQPPFDVIVAIFIAIHNSSKDLQS